MKKERMQLNDLKVTSFVTDAHEVKGGATWRFCSNLNCEPTQNFADGCTVALGTGCTNVTVCPILE